MLFHLLTQVFTRTKKLITRNLSEMNTLRLDSARAWPDEAFLTQFNLEEVSALVNRGDIAGAKKTLLAYYGRRVTPTWPVFPDKITDMDINPYELSQEELLIRAEAILENRVFYGLHAEPEITSSGAIDWRLRGRSQEWLWLLNRHPWWPVLALAYAQTGDERYAAAFVTQMLDWVENNPPALQKDEKEPAWRLMEVGLRLRISWIPSFAIFYHSPAFTDDAKLTMLRAIYDHARFLCLFTSTRNHLLRESNGLAFAGIYFPEFNEAPLWRQTALARLDEELAQQFNQDGSHIEMSTGYQWLVTNEFQATYDLLQANNLILPKEDLAARLENMYHLLAYLVRPDGVFPQINDGFLFSDYTCLARAGNIFGRSDLTYIASAGSQGISPRTTSIGFDDAGLYVMRSDWTREARYLLFDAGPYGGPHGHEDKLNIELFALGQPFIVDPGSYTYDKADPFRRYFVGSYGHNTILVDGQSQIRRWQKENLNPQPASGVYATWISQPDFDYVTATYSDGYADYSFKPAKDAIITDDVKHTRRILFVKPDYWIIIDELQAASPHTYQLLFHTAPDITAKSGPYHQVILSAPTGSARLHLVPAELQNVKVNCLSGSENPVQGWYSSSSQYKIPATAIIYERENVASTVMTTLLYPCTHDQNGPEVRIEPVGVSAGTGLAYNVITPHHSDYLMFSKDGTVKQFGPYQARGAVAGVRTDGRGNILTRFEWAG